MNEEIRLKVEQTVKNLLAKLEFKPGDLFSDTELQARLNIWLELEGRSSNRDFAHYMHLINDSELLELYFKYKKPQKKNLRGI